MRGMFFRCSSLKELNLKNFNTINVTDMSFMFHGCSSLKKLNLLSFNTNNVTNMYCMFDNTNKLPNNAIITNDKKLLTKFNQRRLN